MKNSASNCSAIQVKTKQGLAEQTLQAVTQQILPALTMAFSDLQYSKIAHQRISQQGVSNAIEYQGLTRARHPQFGQVMIKWQLSDDAYQNMAGLAHEADVLKSINKLSHKQDNCSSIAPTLLASHHLQLQMLNNHQTLTILVMLDYANGSLAHCLKQTLTEQQKHELTIQVAQLIVHLHHIGWLHNDIKPSNILLNGFMPNHADISGIVPDLLLTDFALATRMEASTIGHPAGTPAYLAPECWQGHGASVQSDIYAFGIMLYEILVGVRPLQIDKQSREPLKAWAVQHCQQPIPRLPPAYRHYQPIIDQALAKRNKERYSNFSDCLRDLKIAY